MTGSAPSAADLSRALVDTLARTVAENGDAAAARASLAETLRAQGAIPLNPNSPGFAPASTTPAAPVAGALLAEGPFFRPNGAQYLPRKMGKHTDVAAVRKARDSKVAVLTYGEAGTGKSALYEAAFYDKDEEILTGLPSFYTVLGSSDTEVADFVGAFAQSAVAADAYEWVDGPLLCAMERGKPLIVDEIGVIDTRTLVALYSAMDGRGEVFVTANPKRGTVKAAPGFGVFAATNPNAPGVRLSEALLSRFGLTVEVGTDRELARQLGVPSKFLAAVTNLERKKSKGELRWTHQLREMLTFKEISETFGEDIALRNAINQAPETDRPTIADVLSRQYGTSISGLDLS